MKKLSLEAEQTQINEIWEKNLLIWIRELYHIYKDRYVETVAIQNLDLKIYKGELLGILGTSGSGKTTLLKIISGLIPCTTGRIYYKDNNLNLAINIARYDLDRRSDFRLHNIGYISQDINLFSYLTVYENIQIPLYIHKLPEIEHKKIIDEILIACNIENRKEYKILQLSGGEKQRVQVAMALITKPKIIIADEPTANLDSINAKEIFKLFKNISNKYSTTVLIASHDLLLNNYANRICNMKDGRIEKCIEMNKKS